MDSRSPTSQSLGTPALVLVLDSDAELRARTYSVIAGAGYGCVAVGDTAAAASCLHEMDVDLLVHGVSIPRTWDDITNEHLALGELPCPVLLYGRRPDRELEELGWALRAVGYATPTDDGRALLDCMSRSLPSDRVSVPPPMPSRAPHRHESAVRRRPRKLILVDDSEITLEVLQNALTDAGFDVRIAITAAEALAIASAWQPDGAIVDLRRPDAADISLCPALKASGVTVTIVASSIGDDELARASKRSGADGYVSKTRGVRAYVARVEELMENLLGEQPAARRA